MVFLNKIVSAAKLGVCLSNLLIRDPKSARFYKQWVMSMRKGHNPANDGIPWITFRATEWLDKFLKPDMDVFEYGSGGSTIYLAGKVRKITSIESNNFVYDKVLNIISARKISSCEFILCEPERVTAADNISEYGPHSYTSAKKMNLGLRFENYVKSIDRYQDKSFDLIFIDGMARLSCISHAVAKVRPGGYILLDNSEDPDYREGIAMLAGYKREDFFGMAPYSTRLWQTSVWRITG